MLQLNLLQCLVCSPKKRVFFFFFWSAFSMAILTSQASGSVCWKARTLSPESHVALKPWTGEEEEEVQEEEEEDEEEEDEEEAGKLKQPVSLTM